MIVDLNDMEDKAVLDCDVCIIGTGAAGLALANELLSTSLRVIVLESGAQRHEAATQDLYEGPVSGLPYRAHVVSRYRVFGGSTTRWGGQALEFSAHDFEPHDWVALSGWPLPLAQVKPYYSRAARFMLVDTWNFDTDLFKIFDIQPPAFDPDTLVYHFSKWSRQPDLRRVYRRPIARAAHIRLIMHANLMELTLNDALDSVTCAQIRSLEGKTATVRARRFVLCAGGIETARILLANNRQAPAGIGNASGWVGRCFQDHPAAVVGTFVPANPLEFQRGFNIFHRAGIKYAVRFSASPAFLRRHRILNVSGAVLFGLAPDDPVAAMKEIYGLVRRRQFDRGLARKLFQSAAGIGHVWPTIHHYFAKHRTFTPSAIPRLGLITEQEPNRQSQILLSTQTDALGMPRTQIHWDLSDLTGKTIMAFSRVIRDQFAAAGIAQLNLEQWVEREDPNWRDHVTENAHHMGTARMSASPADGVVDTDCRVHGLSNLLIAGSSVFPTGGHSNPTLTLIALSIRTADLLKRELGATLN